MKILDINNRKRGTILLVSLVIFSVLSMLGVYVATISMNNLSQAKETEGRTKAYYLAVSGVEIARGIINSKNGNDYRGIFYGDLSENNSDFQYTAKIDFTNNTGYENIRSEVANFNSTNDYDVVFGIASNSEGKTKVVSTGNTGDISKTVALSLQPVSESHVFGLSIFGIEEVKISGQGKIKGNIGSNELIKITGNAEVDGTVFYVNFEDLDIDGQATIGGYSTLYEELIYEVPEAPYVEMIDKELIVPEKESDLDKDDDKKEYVNLIDSDHSYKKVTVEKNAELTINAINSDIIIIADEFDLQGNITINGTGTVYLYVIDKIKNFASYFKIANNDESEDDKNEHSYDWAKLVIINLGEDTIHFSGHAEMIDLGIYAPESKVKLTGQSGLKGAVVGKKIELEGQGDIDFEYREDLNDITLPVANGSYREVWSD